MPDLLSLPRRLWSRPRAGAVLDVVAVLLLTLLTMGGLRFVHDPAVNRPLSVGTYLLVAGAAGGALVRHRWPAAALVVTAVAVSTYLALGYPYGPIFVFLVLTVYTAARRLPLRPAVGLAVLTLGLLLVHVFTVEAVAAWSPGVGEGAGPPWGRSGGGGGGPMRPSGMTALVTVVIPFTVGLARRLVVAARERVQQAEARQLVDTERLRIAQEVHDVVGHGLAAIQMQADIALHVRDKRPGHGVAALQSISEASALALEELRETLRRIHPEGAAQDTAPTPGLARIGELCERVEAAGVAVTLQIEGAPRPLPPGADLAAYRVLQESLTNVVKHSAHPAARVRVLHTPESVTLRVTNQDLPSVAGTAPAPGLGISGMRRRVAAVGGSFSAGQVGAAGDFQVQATIPRTTQEER